MSSGSIAEITRRDNRGYFYGIVDDLEGERCWDWVGNRENGNDNYDLVKEI
jgi:hypothetical protein